MEDKKVIHDLTMLYLKHKQFEKPEDLYKEYLETSKTIKDLVYKSQDDFFVYSI